MNKKYPPATLADAKAALKFIDADCDRDTWVKVAMSLKSEFTEKGYPLFEEWSARGDKYDPTACFATWTSISKEGGVTICTLFGLAKEAGYKFDGQAADPNTHKLAPAPVPAPRTKADSKDNSKSVVIATTAWKKAEGTEGVAHDYATAKGFSKHGLRVANGWLLVPAQNRENRIQSIQRIRAGQKLNLKGTHISGCYYPIDGKDMLVAVEGWATGMSIHAATGYAVVVVFGKGNFKNVVPFLHEQFPKTGMVIAADVGAESAARKAAKLVGASVVVPPSKHDGADFNDFHLEKDLKAVKTEIDQQLKDNPPEEKIKLATEEQQVKKRLDAASVQMTARQTKSNNKVQFPVSQYPAGMVGDIARYCLKSVPVPNSAFALMAGLLTISLLSRNRYVVFPLNTTLNIYPIEVGETSAGKEGAPNVCKRLAKMVGAGDRIVNDIASGTALQRSLADAPDHSLFYWQDEIWELLMSANAHNSSSQARNIVSFLMTAYSQADESFAGKKYANPKDNIEAINRPYLIFGGATTPARFMEALSDKHIADGFLNRLIVFQALGTPAEMDWTKKPLVPDQLLAKLKALFDDRHMTAETMPEAKRRVVITWKPGALKHIKDFTSKSRKLSINDPKYGALWNRAGENAVKVAGILAVGVNHDKPVITLAQAKWASNLVHQCLESFSDVLRDQLAESEFDKLCKKTFILIRDAVKYRSDSRFGHLTKYGMPRGLLLRCLHVKAQTVTDVVTYLTESKLIAVASYKDNTIYYLYGSQGSIKKP